MPAADPLPNNPAIPGYATHDGTVRYAERFSELDPSHFRLCHGLLMSSIGMGTYLGDSSDEIDAAYTESVLTALASGCNVVDTAINYRFQRSERAVGRALAQAIHRGFSREELIVCTKGGYIPFENEYPAHPYDWVEENLLSRGIVTPDEIHPGYHCMAPMFLYHQLERSLQNLGLSCADIYYLHNPETQLGELNEPRFHDAIEMAFRALERAVYERKIRLYGLATWDGFLESNRARLLQLERLVEVARRAGGDQHHFRMIQLPINLSMTDAFTIPNQKVGDRMMTLLEAAQALNICVVGSATLLQTDLTRNLPPTLRQAIPDVSSDAARAIQFARSIPGLTTALVGMSSPEHVRENLELASMPTLSDHDFHILFGDR